MPANIEDRKILESNEKKKDINDDYAFVDLTDQNESEIKWVQLHQMFDR